MRISTFNDKLNKVANNVYTIEETITMPQNHIYNEYLRHDNVNDDTVHVYTGESLTGNPVGFSLSIPADQPWKRQIRIESNETTLYISYETVGDQVEAEDINELHTAVVVTQNAVNALEEEITGSTSGYTWNRLMGISSEDILDIVTQPSSQSVVAGTQTTFTIEVNGVSPEYQWQYVESGSTVWRDFTGGTSATLTVTPTIEWNNRQIRCVVSNSYGTTVISNTVTLTVTAS